MDLFEKTKGLGLVRILKQADLYPFFRRIDGSKGNNIHYQGAELVMMGSNNYLGLTHDPRVISAATQALQTWGTGCTGSRFLNGNLALHEELESELASFYGTDDALVFASGYMANEGAISSFVGRDDYILSDSENHACIIEGCKLTRSKIIVFDHLNMADLEEKLQALPLEAGKLIITDGVFSMTGRLAPYNKIHELAKKYNARTYVDDAHGLGVVGPKGKGTAANFGLPADIIMGTFSKSLASQGGFICASSEVIEWLRHKARTFMFSAALAPASAAAALQALRVLKAEPQLVERVRANAAYLKQSFDQIGLNTMGTQTCVVPIYIGDDETALVVCQQLLKLGVFTTPVLYPAVPRGNSIIRCSVMATHSQKDLDKAVEAVTQLAPIIMRANEKPNHEAMADGLDISPEMSSRLATKFASYGAPTV
ncbi:MAG: 8-amino-7-oxononanoate synthase [Bdellovibrionales bacterium CG10_big_fil_rev_8_21_14_0_10_45_34]|nr:MAG: 8-amino-7-oxononanoate synthase [Bdellovibrionales bacterium CG10_big_fil_rev_8_21_14_0_10_45_34]